MEFLYRPALSKKVSLAALKADFPVLGEAPAMDEFGNPLRPVILKAVAIISKLLKDGAGGALGRFAFGGQPAVAIEYSENGVREVAVCTSSPSPSLFACRWVAGNASSYSLKDGHETGEILAAAAIWYRWYYEKAGNMTDFQSAFSGAVHLLRDTPSPTSKEKDSLWSAIATIGKLLFSLPPLNADTLVVDKNQNVRQISGASLEMGRFIPTTINAGTFLVLTKRPGTPDGIVSAAEKTVATTIQKAEKTSSSVFPARTDYSETEKSLIPAIPAWYIMPNSVNEICQLITNTTGRTRQKRNFLLRGPSSTGKTSMVRAIAGSLRVPYVTVTCSADTESWQFLGQPMYDADGKVRFVESDFIRAIKNGWCVEVQEPYVIAKQGVLTALNSLLDDGQGITLSTGEYIHRHPDALVFFTTNSTYVGCRKPNQSVLRRMGNIYDVNLPAPAEVAQRVRAVTGFSNDALLLQMIAVAEKISTHCREQGVDDGVCGVSEIMDWVETFQVTGRFYDSATTTIVAKATDDPETQAAIIGLIESAFSGADVEAESGLFGAPTL